MYQPSDAALPCALGWELGSQASLPTGSLLCHHPLLRGDTPGTAISALGGTWYLDQEGGGKRPSHLPNALRCCQPRVRSPPGSVCALSQDISPAPTLLVPRDSGGPVRGQEGATGHGPRCQEVEESAATSPSRGGGW